MRSCFVVPLMLVSIVEASVLTEYISDEAQNKDNLDELDISDERDLGNAVQTTTCGSNTVKKIGAGGVKNLVSYQFNKDKLYAKGCDVKTTVLTKIYAPDPLVSFGYQITGHFYGIGDGETDCSKTDHLEIDDAQGIVKMFCGLNVEIDMFSASDIIEIYFRTTADTYGGKGYNLKVDSVELCGGQLNPLDQGGHGVITTPFYPDNYPPSAKCIWFFMGHELSGNIKVECDTFQLEERSTNENGTESCGDFLSVATEVEIGQQEYCSTDLGTASHTIYSPDHKLVMVFQSDTSTEQPGFSCRYEFLAHL